MCSNLNSKSEDLRPLPGSGCRTAELKNVQSNEPFRRGQVFQRQGDDGAQNLFDTGYAHRVKDFTGKASDVLVLVVSQFKNDLDVPIQNSVVDGLSSGGHSKYLS